MSLAGEYEVMTKTPMGDQNGVLVVVPADDGQSFTGRLENPMGNMDVEDGVIDGNTLIWKSKVVIPMPMTLECTATIDGDILTGEVQIGAFGKMPLEGRRKV
jgi:hypothetical protein